MNKSIQFALLFLFLLPTICWSNESLVGIWSATLKTKGGLAGQWTFSIDGKTSFIFGALVDFRYEIDKNNIRILKKQR